MLFILAYFYFLAVLGGASAKAASITSQHSVSSTSRLSSISTSKTVSPSSNHSGSSATSTSHASSSSTNPTKISKTTSLTSSTTHPLSSSSTKSSKSTLSSYSTSVLTGISFSSTKTSQRSSHPAPTSSISKSISSSTSIVRKSSSSSASALSTSITTLVKSPSSSLSSSHSGSSSRKQSSSTASSSVSTKPTLSSLSSSNYQFSTAKSASPSSTLLSSSASVISSQTSATTSSLPSSSSALISSSSPLTLPSNSLSSSVSSSFQSSSLSVQSSTLTSSSSLTTSIPTSSPGTSSSLAISTSSTSSSKSTSQSQTSTSTTLFSTSSTKTSFTVSSTSCGPYPSVVCDGDCTNLWFDEANCGVCGNSCTQTNGVCDFGSCYNCPEGETACDAGTESLYCTDTDTDPKNCGGCGITCPSNQCAAGECCPVGLGIGISCVDYCVSNPQTNMTSCGECGNACEEPGYFCSYGSCEPCNVDGGYGVSIIAGDPFGNQNCKDLQNDAQNCGKCGLACSSEQCAAGQCCPDGAIACGDTCILHPNTDINNCGSCGNVCTAPENYCTLSSCEQCSFDEGYGLCPYGDSSGDTICKDLQNDGQNCGSCGNACPSNQCASGQCCPEYNLACGGSCISPNNDTSNCGNCGWACSSPDNYCSFSQCQECDSSSGLTLCPAPAADGVGNTICTDTSSDPQNCGYCGNVCPNDQCALGICCSEYTRACGDNCVFTNNDTSNCGSCDTVCADGEVCAYGGSCISCNDQGFGPGWGPCPFINQGVFLDYWCADLWSDGDGGGCGTCGYTCPVETPSCNYGVCAQCPIDYHAEPDDAAPLGWACFPDTI